MSANYISFNTINNTVTYNAVSSPVFTDSQQGLGGHEASLLAVRAQEQSSELGGRA